MAKRSGRIWAYSISLILAFAAFLISARSYGWLFLGCGGAILGFLCVGALRDARSILYFSAWSAAALTFAPFVATGSAGPGGLAYVPHDFPASQLFATLLASRLLASLTFARFAIFYRNPLAEPVGRFSSLGSSVALAAFFVVAFYAVFGPMLAAERSGPAGIVLSALAGGSWIHLAVIFAIFLSLALIAEAALRHRADLAALNRLRVSLNAPTSTASGCIDEEIMRHGPSLAAHLVGRATGCGSLSHYEEYVIASRRFARTLPGLLPLLGFVGTVIGLSMTMLELEKGLSGGLTAGTLAAALTGLGLKFETTLLGLLGNLAASALLDLLESSEAQCAAACRVVGAAWIARRDEAPR